MAVAEQSLPGPAAPETARAAAWRWVQLGVAAAVMVATLPGRTHGLGLITEPLLADLRIDRLDYAAVNLWATLLGAAFCLPCGWLLDRLGSRYVLLGVTTLLGAVVVAMSWLAPDSALPLLPALFLLVLLTRGLGQSALSVVSLAVMGRAAGRRAGVPVGVYSAAVAVGFMGAFAAVKFALEQGGVGWRPLWAGIGWTVIAFGALACWLLPTGRSVPASEQHEPKEAQEGMTLAQALRTPAFWVFGVATSFYGLVISGISLFNQAILQERGFDRDVFLTVTMFSPLVGLAGNLAGGWVAARWSHGRVLAVAL